MKAELSKKLRDKLGVAQEIGDEQLAEMVGEKFLAVDTNVATLTQERDTAVAASRLHIPAPMDADVLADRHEIATGKIDIAVAKGDLPSVIANRLKESLKVDGKPAPAAMSRAAATGNREPWRYVLEMFDGSGLGPQITGEPKTGNPGKPVAASRTNTDDGPPAKTEADMAKEATEKALNERMGQPATPAK